MRLEIIFIKNCSQEREIFLLIIKLLYPLYICFLL